MGKKYEEDLRVVQTRGVVSQKEAAARGAAVPPGEKPQEDATSSLKPPAAEASPRVDVPLTPASPTLSLQPTSSAANASPQEPAFPAPGWARYQPVRFLGQGGMGRVYLAYDPMLRRNVALKFVRGDDPELLRRFVSEAQAQARVEHERVCKVYEAGEVQGQPFIAMQYVDGRSLLELVGELSVEQKVMVVQQATEGVHAAHRAGLIHRDIKPSNILVERGEDGQWKPYVMDFGLARDWQRETTVTGTVLGTPHYMAPEQARGEVSRLDRRADVYSLGATLYVLLTGKTPIPGSNALEVLTNLATLEPRPLRELDRNVPADLEAIVLKCLEREPSARYDSARALAEDLGRFLNGEPVQAGAVGTWYRLRKRVRKHWALVSMASVALVLVGLALGQVALTRRDADLRERVARRFADLAGDVRAEARYMALSRLHDIRIERQALRARLDQIEREMQQGGERALGPGHYALGQGWLDLGEPARAREHLEESWKYDKHDPRVAAALALALGRLYNEQLQSEQLDNGQLPLGALPPEQRQTRRAELARLYRAPALSWLRLSQGESVIPPEYQEALLAFYEQRYDDALLKLEALGEKKPWFYEAPALRGDILHLRAMVRWDEGAHTEGDRAQAQAGLEAARKAYSLAADIAQSLPEAHHGLARIEWATVSMKLYAPGEVQPHIERALEHLARALKVDPDHAASWVLRATLYRNLVESRGLYGSEAEEPLRLAVESARKALAISPSHLEARKELGMDLWMLASKQLARGLDPREALRQASETFESVEPDKRDFYIHHGLGLVFQTWATYEEQLGADSLLNRGKAIEAFGKVLELKDQYAPAWINLALQYYKRAALPQAPAVDEDLDRAWQALERGRALGPRDTNAVLFAGKIQLLRARRLRNTGADERPMLTAALETCRKGLAIDPSMVSLHNHAGLVLMEQARGAWERGEDPLPLLDLAQQALEQARAVAPARDMVYNLLADLHAERAIYLRARGQDPRKSARAALQAAQEARQRAPAHPFPLINLGHASQLLAAFEWEARGDPRPHLAEATAQLHQALERSPSNAEAWLYLAETRAVQARWQAQQGRGVDKDFEEAAQAYERALKTAERPLDYRLAFGRFCREWAAWRQRVGLAPHPPLARGMELAETVLAARPMWAAPRALRDSLQKLRESLGARLAR